MKGAICVVVASLSLLIGCASPGGGGGATKEGTSATSQRLTVDDLAAKGGKKLSSAEIEALASGATMEGPAAFTGSPFRTVLGADGTLKGEVRPAAGPVALEGTWRVNGLGQLCTALTLPRPSSDCAFLYSANGTHYGALKDEPKADVLERRFSK